MLILMHFVIQLFVNSRVDRVQKPHNKAHFPWRKKWIACHPKVLHRYVSIKYFENFIFCLLNTDQKIKPNQTFVEIFLPLIKTSQQQSTAEQQSEYPRKKKKLATKLELIRKSRKTSPVSLLPSKCLSSPNQTSYSNGCTFQCISNNVNAL